ncbi:MAG: beta-ketoacyl-[acyl-carrier-protein] synthase family protein [Planctomycetota bacterium]
MNRIFITGIGAVSCLGNDRRTLWKNLLAGQCGIDTLRVHDTRDMEVNIGGEVLELNEARVNVNDSVSARKMDRASQFAVHAAFEALEDAGLPVQDIGENAAVILGAGLAGLETYETQHEKLLTRGPSRVSPFTIPMLMPNAPPGNVSLAFGIRGTAYTTSSACSSSGHAMIDAFEYLRRGDADFVVTGGTEASLTRLGISSFVNMRAMNKSCNERPRQSMRPFDADRGGFIMSEGASILIFETEEHLRRRGGKAWAEVLSGRSTSDSFHLTQPDPQGRQAVRAIQQALRKAGLDPDQIAGETYVSAHGTSTHYNDAMETVALKSVFNNRASDLHISSIKSMLGHMIGAACAIEMSACALALSSGLLPPTINYDTPDPECNLNYIPNIAVHKACRYAINNSFGFGGHNVSLVIGRVDDPQLQRTDL